MFVDESISMPLLPTTFSWTYERDLLPLHNSLRHRLYRRVHLYSSSAVPAHTRSLGPSDRRGMHQYARYAHSHCSLEQFQ